MATGVRVGITLACVECKRRNYQTTKSKRNDPDRIEFKKFVGESQKLYDDAWARFKSA